MTSSRSSNKSDANSAAANSVAAVAVAQDAMAAVDLNVPVERKAKTVELVDEDVNSSLSL